MQLFDFGLAKELTPGRRHKDDETLYNLTAQTGSKSIFDLFTSTNLQPSVLILTIFITFSVDR
jgi:hypothetical protein